MSAYIVKIESIQNIARALAYCSRATSGRALYLKSSSLRDAFGDCRDTCGELDENRIAAALYKMNARAVSDRYKKTEPALLSPSDFKLGENLIFENRLCELAKTIGCYLYQCTEGGVPEDPKYKAIKQFEIYLYRLIVSELPEYRGAPWA